MITAAQLAALGSLGVGGLVVLLLGAVTAEHLVRTRRQVRDARRRAELAPVVHGLLDDEDGGAVSPGVAGAPALLDDLVIDLLPQLRGADRRCLQRVLAARGVVARAAADTRARAAWRRGRAATLLGSAAVVEHTGELAALLGDRSAEVRCAAARGLGKAGDPASVGPLLAALTAARTVPLGVVGMAVLDLGTPVLPVLRAALQNGSPEGRRLAAEVLGLHGDVAAAPALVTLLGDDGQPGDVRAAAAGALGRIGTPTATAPLVQVLSGAPGPELQRTCAEALRRIGDPEAVPALTAGLGSTDRGVRAACADALAGVGDEGSGRLGVLAIADTPSGRSARAALDAVAVTAAARRRPVASR